MSVEILSNQLDINEREKKLKNAIDEFKTLITKKFKEQELQKINEALDLMLEIHLPQRDRHNGDPYAAHPLEVAKNVLEIGDKVSADLIIAALLHDSAEDMPEILFAKRANRKFPKRNYELKVNEQVKNNNIDILRDWSFKEIEEQFGSKVTSYLRHITHDFDSLAEELSNLSEEEKNTFKNQAYICYIEDIIEDSDLCLLKCADFSKNIDLKGLSPESEKYLRLKRKYTSIIPIFINKLKSINESHQLYSNKEVIINELEDVYQKYYSN